MVCITENIPALDMLRVYHVLRGKGVRLIGPNCVGVMDTVSGFNTNFDIGSYPRGGISVLTQSGAFGNSFLFASGTSGRVGAPT